MEKLVHICCGLKIIYERKGVRNDKIKKLINSRFYINCNSKYICCYNNE